MLIAVLDTLPALPFCHVALKAEKPKSPKYPKNLETMGNQIRKRRLDLGLLQKEVAIRIGVSETTIYNWEQNVSSPQVHQLPGVIQFLGYNPFPAAGSPIERLTAARKTLGFSQKRMAKWLGIDPCTLRFWEKGKRRPSMKLSRIIGDFLSTKPEV